MTSAKLFFNLLGNTMKRRMGVVLISALAFFLYFLSQVMELTVYQNEEVLFGLKNQNLIYLTAGAALLCAYQGFGYLFSSKTTDFYYSLPASRNLLFLVNYVHGLFVFVIPFWLTQAACITLFAGQADKSDGILSYTVCGFVLIPLIYMGMYHLVLIAIVLTGHAAVSAGILVVMVTYVRIITDQIVLPYCELFFSTFYRLDFLKKLQTYTDPFQIMKSAMHGITDVEVNGYGYEIDIVPLLVLLTGVILSFCLIAVLLKVRKAECAGRAVAFEWMKPFLRVAIGIPAALLSAYFMMFCTEKRLSAGIAGVITGILAAHLLLEVLFRFRLRKVSLHKMQLAAGMALGIGILSSFYLGKDFFNNYIPELESLDAVAIVVDGLDYGTGQEKQDEFWGGQMVESYRLVNLKLKEKTMKAGYRWIQKTMRIPPDTKLDQVYTTDTVAYYKKDGSVIYRKYTVQTKEELDSFNEVYTSREYKNGLYTILDVQDTKEHSFIWSNGVEKRTLQLTEEEKEELFAIYTKELYALTLEDAERSLPIGMLTVEHTRSGESANGYIYPEFINTVQYLRKKQLPVEKTVAGYKIIRIDIEYLDSKTERVYKKEVVDEEDKIREISAGLVYEGYAIEPLLNPVDRSCELTVHLKNQETLEESEVRCYFIHPSQLLG